MCTKLLKAAMGAALSKRQKSVLSVLSWFANNQGECSISYALICERSSISERTVARAIRELQAMNVIQVDARNGLQAIYRIKDCAEWTTNPAPETDSETPDNPCQNELATPDNLATPDKWQPLTNWQGYPRQNGRGSEALYIKVLSKPISKPKTLKTYTPPDEKPAPQKAEKPAPKTDYSPIDDLISRGVDSQTIADWLTHRKNKKAAVTATVVKLIAGEADKASMSLSDALQLCCMRGWQGFKAEWVVSPTARLSPSGKGYESERDKARRKVQEAIRGAGGGNVIEA